MRTPVSSRSSLNLPTDLAAAHAMILAERKARVEARIFGRSTGADQTFSHEAA